MLKKGLNYDSLNIEAAQRFLNHFRRLSTAAQGEINESEMQNLKRHLSEFLDKKSDLELSQTLSKRQTTDLQQQRQETENETQPAADTETVTNQNDEFSLLSKMSIRTQSDWLSELDHALRISYDHPWLLISRNVDKRNQLKISISGKVEKKITNHDMKVNCFEIKLNQSNRMQTLSKVF